MLTTHPFKKRKKMLLHGFPQVIVRSNVATRAEANVSTGGTLRDDAKTALMRRRVIGSELREGLANLSVDEIKDVLAARGSEG